MDDANATDRSSMKDAARSAADEFGHTVHEVRGEAAAQARRTGEQVRDRAEASLEGSKSQLVGRIGTLARAIRDSSRIFHEEGQPDAARQTEELAARVEEIRSFLEDYHVRDAYDDVAGAVRRRPALLVGGALAAVVVATAVYVGSRRGNR